MTKYTDATNTNNSSHTFVTKKISMGLLIFSGIVISAPVIAVDFSAPTNHANQGLPHIAIENRTVIDSKRITNLEASIPPQCYTKTESVNNPCYVCHQAYDDSNERMNRLNDGYLQGTYLFSEIGVDNHWTNLFVDRTDWIDTVADETIQNYVNQDNYTNLASTLKEQKWNGYTPDLANFQLAAAAFDKDGFALDNSNWVAYNYKPLPSTFWPTNGSTGDAAIRLPEKFRTLNGIFDKEVYQANLAIIEMTIKQKTSITTPPINEQHLQIDLNDNKQLDQRITTINQQKHYVGDAKSIAIIDQQFPAETEMLHSVRYIGVDKDNSIVIPPRMKELRYMKKIRALTKDQLSARYSRERKDKFLGELPDFVSHGDDGMENGLGWVLQGFIEDYDGELRPQSYEEKAYCMGCHSATGSSIDSTWSFARKMDGIDGWGYINLKAMPDVPSISQDEGEILQYLRTVGGGSEFRSNPEMTQRYFLPSGKVNAEKVAASDVYTLITPSPERAQQLNKAYSHIVRHQNYIEGRDATWLPMTTIHETVDETEPPLNIESQLMGWDIRLDWNKASTPTPDKNENASL
jgi:hypothetical protein